MTIIVCHHALCVYWVSGRCSAASIEVDSDGSCLTQDEDIDELDDGELIRDRFIDEEDDDDPFEEDWDDEEEEDTDDNWAE